MTKRKSNQSNEDMNANRNNARDRNRLYVYNYLLEHPCIVCGESDPIVLEFNHRNPDDKRRNVSEMVTGPNSLALIRKEIDKCEVMCRNCHQRHTAKQFNWRIFELLEQGVKVEDYIYYRKPISKEHIEPDPSSKTNMNRKRRSRHTKKAKEYDERKGLQNIPKFNKLSSNKGGRGGNGTSGFLLLTL